MTTLGEVRGRWQERIDKDDPEWPAAMVLTLYQLGRELNEALVDLPERLERRAKEIQQEHGGYGPLALWHWRQAFEDELAETQGEDVENLVRLDADPGW